MLNVLRDMIWSFPLFLFLFVFGFYLFVKLKGFPLTRLGWIIKTTFGSFHKENRNQKQVLSVISVALGGTMGIGNIVGASSCVLLFGPGSLFWIWISAIIGMVLKYAEIVLAMVYRKYRNHEYYGGPMVNMVCGLQMPKVARVYAGLCFIISLGIGNLVPMNALVMMFKYRLHFPKFWLVLGLGLFIGVVLFKGSRMIEKVCLYMVPLMTILFTGATLFMVLIYMDQLPDVLTSIFHDVFSYSSLIGGGLWTQLQMGLARGIYSNEAGLGTSSIVHCKSQSVHPVEQGAWGVIEVMIDTLVSCTLSALVVLLLKDQVVSIDAYQAIYVCFQYVFGSIGDWIYFVSMLFFAVSGMLAWCYYAKESLHFLGISDRMMQLYPYVFLFVLVAGSYMQTDAIWAMTDIGNGFMLLLNMSTMVALRLDISNCTKKYFQSYRNHVK